MNDHDTVILFKIFVWFRRENCCAVELYETYIY